MYANTFTPTVHRIKPYSIRPTADGIINYHQLPMKMENSYHIGKLGTSMVILVNTKTILLVCGESDNMPLLCQLVVTEGMFGPTLHAYVANVLWSTKMAVKCHRKMT